MAEKWIKGIFTKNIKIFPKKSDPNMANALEILYLNKRRPEHFCLICFADCPC